MASYTDAISQFNPYVQQLPVDLMMKVGMQKQAQYDQGVQKIQQSIDNVAGLDIYRNVDKEHLQSKMNELGNNLRIVAGGDFANQQLVNSVAGMTGSIIKDPVIRAAVSSTAKIKAGYAKRKELEKEGLTDKNNDDLYADSVSKYANNEELTDAEGNPVEFSGEYIPYTDIMKMAKEYMANIGLDESTVEEIFVTDPITKRPQMQYEDRVNPKTKKVERVEVGLKYADAKVLEKLKSNKEAVVATLDNLFSRGDVQRQLRIDGWATYRNTDADMLLQPMKEQHEEQDISYQDQAMEISTMLLPDNDLSEEQRKYLEEKSKQLEINKLSSEKEFAQLYELSQKNPEKFKEYYYEQNFKNRLKKQFLKEDKSFTSESSAYKQQENWYKNFDFENAKYETDISFRNANLIIAQRADQRAAGDSEINKQKFEIEYPRDPITGLRYKADFTKPKRKELSPLDIVTGSVSGDELPVNYAVGVMSTDIEQLDAKKIVKGFDLYSTFVKETQNNSNLSKEQIESILNGNARKKGVTPQEYLNDFVLGIKDKYTENKLKWSPSLAEQFDDYTELNKELYTKKQLDARALADAKSESSVDVVPTKIRTKTGWFDEVEFVASPEDQMNYYLISGKIDKDHPWYNKEPSERMQLTEQVRQKLDAKFGKVTSNWYRGFVDTFGPTGDKFKGKGFMSAYNTKLENLIGASDRKAGRVNMANTEQKDAAIGQVMTFLDAAKGKRSFTKLDGSSATLEELKKAAGNPSAITWGVKTPTTSQEDWVGDVTVTDEKTGESYVIKNLNSADLEPIADVTFGNYTAKPIQTLIRANKTESTNPTYTVNSPNAWKAAYFQDNEAPAELRKAGYTYRADVVLAKGGFRMVHYIQAPDSKKFQTIFGERVFANENDINVTFKNSTLPYVKATYINYLKNKK
jgi:hypothetical protein